jgi:hypothetical protein
MQVRLKRELSRARVVLSAVFRRMFSRPARFSGSAEKVCSDIIAKLWNNEYYQTGLGHFNFFWMRDFAIVANSLIAIGERDKVRQTLTWALDQYQKAGYVTLCLDSFGEAFDLPGPSIDALPWLLYALRIADLQLSPESLEFLEKETLRYCEAFIDKRTGCIRSGVYFSELRDAVKYRQSAYAVTMLAVLARELAYRNIVAPSYLRQDYPAVLKDMYWNGSYFNADIDNGAFSVEGNLFPFLLGIVDDHAMLQSVLDVIRQKNLTSPYLMQYTDKPRAFRYRWWGELFMWNYAGDTVWTWHGILYLHLLQEIQHPAETEEMRKFSSLIERNKNFPEILHPDGTWYKTPFYRAEEGMIWAALYLKLLVPNP